MKYFGVILWYLGRIKQEHSITGKNYFNNVTFDDITYIGP